MPGQDAILRQATQLLDQNLLADARHQPFEFAETTRAFSVYSASKAALRNFARGWILDLAPRRIRVNVLVPGATSTPGWHGLAPNETVNRDMIRLVESTTPLARLADPSEVAAAALFLASDDSSFVNGSELFVDGGAARI